MEVNKKGEKSPEPHLTPDEWANWKSHPVTKKVLTYLHDFRIQLADDIAGQVSVGDVIDPDSITKDTLRCEALLLTEEITADEINYFYLEEEEDKDNELS